MKRHVKVALTYNFKQFTKKTNDTSNSSISRKEKETLTPLNVAN